MTLQALLLVLAQAAPPLGDLAHESRAVRDEAIRTLAAGGPPSAEIAALLLDPDDRVALGAAEVLRLRRDPAVLPLLARAADVPDATRGAAAAAALVATAGDARVAVDSLGFEGMSLLPARLDDAWRDAVREALLPLAYTPSVDRPQAYRALYAGGAHSAHALLELARDSGARAEARAHALHAHARLTAEAPVGALADAEPVVRQAAAVLVLRYGDADALARLAARLDEAGALQASEIHCAAQAVRRTRRVGKTGAAALERAVRDGEPRLAADAAAALVAAEPEAGAKALRTRVQRHLSEADEAAGTGTEAVLFALRCGPLPEDLRARMGAMRDPLLAACVAEDPLGRLRPLLGTSLGSREMFRVEVVTHVFDRHAASPRDRLAFAASTLPSDTAAVRRAGFEALRGVPAESWAALRPLAVAALAEHDESVRLAAAALLLPEAEAVAVCADALYDGDPWSARRVLDLLAKAGLKTCDPRAGVAERRKAALELRRPGG